MSHSEIPPHALSRKQRKPYHARAHSHGCTTPCRLELPCVQYSFQRREVKAHKMHDACVLTSRKPCPRLTWALVANTCRPRHVMVSRARDTIRNRHATPPLTRRMHMHKRITAAHRRRATPPLTRRMHMHKRVTAAHRRRATPPLTRRMHMHKRVTAAHRRRAAMHATASPRFP
jgi:hypothetical protein